VSRSGDFDLLSTAEVEVLARVAREGRHRKPPKHPTGLEWRAKLRQQDQQDAAIFPTAAYAGLRLGELRSLRWRDLDFTKRLIHVRHSYVMRNEDAPKSGRVRSVPMIDQVATALDQLSRRNGWTGEEDPSTSSRLRDVLAFVRMRKSAPSGRSPPDLRNAGRAGVSWRWAGRAVELRSGGERRPQPCPRELCSRAPARRCPPSEPRLQPRRCASHRRLKPPMNPRGRP
jgi:integrase